MIWKYLLTAMLGITVPMAGYAYATMNDRLDHAEAVATDKGERIATLEAEIRGLRAQVSRMEDKLDLLLERRR